MLSFNAVTVAEIQLYSTLGPTVTDDAILFDQLTLGNEGIQESHGELELD